MDTYMKKLSLVRMSLTPTYSTISYRKFVFSLHLIYIRLLSQEGN